MAPAAAAEEEPETFSSVPAGCSLQRLRGERAGRAWAPPCPGECSAFPGSLHPGPCSGRVTGLGAGSGLGKQEAAPAFA